MVLRAEKIRLVAVIRRAAAIKIGGLSVKRRPDLENEGRRKRFMFVFYFLTCFYFLCFVSMFA